MTMRWYGRQQEYQRKQYRMTHTLMTTLFDNDSSFFPVHHTAIKTRNITMAMQFYSLLGFEATTKFRAGPAKAAWLEPRHRKDDGEEGGGGRKAGTHDSESNSPCRLELIEVPAYLLEDEMKNSLPDGRMPIVRAPNLIQKQTILGYNHLALDVTSSIRQLSPTNVTKQNLAEWLTVLNRTSIDRFGKTIRIAVNPYQTLIGNGVYELAFLYDADGALIELLHKQSELSQEIRSGWDPTERIEFLQ